MATGKPPSDAPGAFSAIATDPSAMRSFLGSIGDAHAASRQRICELLEPCDHVLDIGCGPAVTFCALQQHRQRDRGNTIDGGRQWSYCGVDPVRAMLEAARTYPRLPILAERERLDGEEVRRTGGLVVVPWPFENASHVLRHCEYSKGPGEPPCADGVVLRHVLEHLQDPAPLLRSAARSVRPGGRLVVVLSQASRAVGLPLPLLTDCHLGARRWSHWRPTLHQAIAGAIVGASWKAVANLTQYEGLHLREELMCWERQR